MDMFYMNMFYMDMFYMNMDMKRVYYLLFISSFLSPP